MELRVIVIAVVSLIVVSMSFVMQGRVQKNPSAVESGINLIEQPTSHKYPINRTLSSESFDMGSSSNLLHSDKTNHESSERSTSSPTSSGLEEEADGETLELDLPIQRNTRSIYPSSSGMGPSTDSLMLTANEYNPPSDAPGEQLLAPAPGLEPLETMLGDSSATSDSTLPVSDASATTDKSLSTADVMDADSVMLDAPPAAPLEVAPLAESPAAPDQNASAEEIAMSDAASAAVAPQREIPPSVSQIARNHLEYGNSLARRGSLFSARQEFFSGLRLIIESLDLVNGSTAHREHYDLAITALNEAEDFTQGGGDEVSASVARVVELHQSKIISAAEAPSLTPMAAMQTYFAFAQNHFSAACGHSTVASELLFGLGKLYTVKASQDTSGEPIDLAISILMHQAALNVDPNNFLSANELGVALAKLGHYEPARAALLHSVATKPTPEAWLNLSIVHRQLGETQLAELALAEKKAAETSLGRESSVAQQIRWMTPNEFSSSAQQVNFEDPSPATAGAPAKSEPAGSSSPKLANENFWSKFKRSFGTK